MVICIAHLQAMTIAIDGSRKYSPILLKVSHLISQLQLLAIRQTIVTVVEGYHFAKALSCTWTATLDLVRILFGTERHCLPIKTEAITASKDADDWLRLFLAKEELRNVKIILTATVVTLISGLLGHRWWGLATSYTWHHRSCLVAHRLFVCRGNMKTIYLKAMYPPKYY